jgi:hypothetical protein
LRIRAEDGDVRVDFERSEAAGGDTGLPAGRANVVSSLIRRRKGLASARDEESGAVLIEAAMILPLIVILFMGIIDFGLAIADFNSLRQGDREGVRRAVVADVGGDTSCSIGGTPPSNDTAALICLTKDKTGLSASKTRVAVKFDADYTEGDALILCAQYPLNSRTGFFGFLLNSKVVHSQVDMRIEKATLDIQEFSETGGDGWDWCG